jgi:hypothetical protein
MGFAESLCAARLLGKMPDYAPNPSISLLDSRSLGGLCQLLNMPREYSIPSPRIPSRTRECEWKHGHIGYSAREEALSNEARQEST